MDSSRAAGGAVPRVLPFRHVRLAAYFVLLAALGVAGGIFWLRQSADAVPPQRAEWILAFTVLAVAALGFAGVLTHRLRVLPLRWQETQNYLKAIQRESEKYRLLMEGAADMLVLIDPATRRVREWNARAREGLGLATGAPAPALDALLDAGDLARLDAGLDQAAKAGAQAVPIGELRLRALSGAVLVADARLAAIALEDERVVLLALRDVTRQKEIEKELQVRDRLATIGLLTAGVAHEVNNPLEGIANYLRLASREGLTHEARAAHLEQVRYGFERIRGIVRQLLQLARPTAGEMGVLDLRQIVERACKLAASGERARQLELATRGLERPIEVVGDAGAIEQVVINLILNAAAAMEGRGRIELSARAASGPDGRPGVELAVEDEGPGIPPENLERLFDPFFSTSGGTGLGLSVSLGIARAHGGTLAAANRPGGGARFTLHLPVRGAT
jgi:PAS domain S-box-containing protein